MKAWIKAGFALSAFGLTLASADRAGAAWRRFNAAHCQASGSNDDYLKYEPFKGLYNTKTGTLACGGSGSSCADPSMGVMCPVFEDSALWVDSVARITVNVESAACSPNGVRAKACVLFDGAVGGACGAEVTTPSSGVQTLTVPRGPWPQTWFGEAFAGDFPYLAVFLKHVLDICDPSTTRFAIRHYGINTE